MCLENQKTNPDGVLEKCVEKINSISSSDFEKVELGIKCSNPPFLACRYRYKKEFIMKKTVTILLTTFISFSIFAKTPEYRIKLSDKLDIGTSKSYECVATIAHLAEFPEYSSSWANLSAYDSYFKPYLSNKDVQAAIKTF